MEKKRRTEIAELGEFGLIDLLTSGFEPTNDSTLRAAGDDAAVILPPAGEAVLCSTDLLTEGVDFDLTYFPLKHLGYKAVTVAGSDILAMNARPSQLMVSLGVSAKMSVEALQELYEGIVFRLQGAGDRSGRRRHEGFGGNGAGAEPDGGRACPQGADRVRGGATKQNDLICISGNLGAAAHGAAAAGARRSACWRTWRIPNRSSGDIEYLLEKYLAGTLWMRWRREAIVPTSMIDLSDGLASDLLQICKASKCGARIYLDRIPIAKQTYALAGQVTPIHAGVAALNGGEDHELLFTVPLAMQEQVMKMGCVDVIGHITPESTGAYLVTPDGSDIRGLFQAPGVCRERVTRAGISDTLGERAVRRCAGGFF